MVSAVVLLNYLYLLCVGVLIALGFASLLRIKGKFKKLNYDTFLLVTGTLFSSIVLINTIVTISLIKWVNSPTRQGMFLDLHPIDFMLETAMNWIIPSVIVILLIAIIFERKSIVTLKGLIGFILCSISIATSIFWGFYLFMDFLSFEILQEVIWWL